MDVQLLVVKVEYLSVFAIGIDNETIKLVEKTDSKVTLLIYLKELRECNR